MTTVASTLVCAGAAIALAPVLLRVAGATAHQPVRSTAATGVVVATSLAVFGAGAGAQLGVAGGLAVLLLLVPAAAAAIVDARERRLPDPLTAALAGILAALIAVGLAIGHPAVTSAVWGFVIGLVMALAGRLASAAAVGWGDVKLAPSLVAILAGAGWPAVYAGLLAWTGLILATALLVAVRRGRDALVPYGPAMVIGTALAVVATG